MVSGDRSHTAVLHRRTIKGKLNLNNQNKYDEANAAFAETSCNKGIALYSQGKYNKTIDAYDEAIKLNPTKNQEMYSFQFFGIYRLISIFSTRNVYNWE